MKNSSQIITILLSVLFFGYIFYTYTPVEKIDKHQELKNDGIGLFSIFGLNPLKFEDSADTLYISNGGEIDLLQKMFIEYNKMNASGVANFFTDTCEFDDLSGKSHQIYHEDFEGFFNEMDSVMWTPLAIVPLKIKERDSWRTGTIIHSIEERFPKEGDVWRKELIEIFYIKEGKIDEVNQFGKESQDWFTGPDGDDN